MTFLNPIALVLLAAAPVVIALYLIRNRRRRFVAPTLLFWQRAQARHESRRLLGALRNPLSLLLQLLILLLLILAASQVEWDDLVVQRPTLIVLDNRLGMNAESATGSAFSRAADLAGSLASGASEGTPVALITSGRSPTIVSALTADGAAIQDAIDRLEPTQETGQLDAAVGVAQKIANSIADDTSIIVLSDRPFPTPEDLPESIDFRSVTVGADLPNGAITSFGLERSAADPSSTTAFLRVSNFSDAPLASTVDVEIDGEIFETLAIDVGPGGEQDLSFTLPLPVSGEPRGVVAELQTNDAIASDNRAFAILPTAEPVRVLLVTSGNRFLEDYLRAEEMASYELLGPESWNPSFADAFDVVVFDARADLAFGSANALFLGASPFGSGDEMLEAPAVTEAQRDHPILQGLDLNSVRMIRAQQFPEDPQLDGYEIGTLFGSVNAPLLVVGENPTTDQRIAATAFGMLDSDLPLRAAYPLLMRNLLFWLAGRQVDLPEPVPAGSLLTLGEGEKLTAFEPDQEAATAIPLATGPGLTRLRQTGLYRLQGDVPRLIAVNSFSDAESDLREATSEGSATGAGGPIRAFFSGPLWYWLGLAAFLLLATEWSLYHARRTE